MPVPADYRELSSAWLDGRHVEALWSFTASSSGEHVVLPDGRIDLIVRYQVDPGGVVVDLEPAIIGPSQRHARVPVDVGDCFLGLRYRAGWGGVCLGVDPSSLRDSGLHGDAALKVLGSDADLLRHPHTPETLKEALLVVSRRRAAACDRQAPAAVAKAIDLLHLAGGRLAVADVARAVGVPERTLRRHVRDAAGLSFKALSSVLRFQRTMRLLAASPDHGLSLAQAAVEGGYSDQAHMTHEFRRHGGFTPGARPLVAFGSLPIG